MFVKTTELIRVLLVDDHPIVRDGCRLLLKNTTDILVAGEAENGEQACDIYGEVTPDVVVLDLNMSGMGGMETIRRLRRVDPCARVLVFSVHDNQTMVQKALEAGADGYLTKVGASSRIAEAIRHLAQGRAYLDQDLVPHVLGALSGDGDPVRRLTLREFEVFRNLAAGNTVNEIAKMLCISPKTAGVHQTNLLKKLNVRNGSELTRLAIRYQLIEP